MRTAAKAVIALVALLWIVPTGKSQESQSGTRGKGFDAFALTKARNIFDPERRAMRVESADTPSTQSAPPRPDYIALTGTMVTPGKALAFFSGSRSEYNRVVPISEKLGDCTLVAIGGNQVELERKGKPVTLEVGKQLTLDEVGTISTASISESAPAFESSRRSDDYRRDDSRREDDRRRGDDSRRDDDNRRRDDSRSRDSGSSSSPPSESSSPPAPAGAPAAPAPDKAELLRRMMERRQKEISK